MSNGITGGQFILAVAIVVAGYLVANRDSPSEYKGTPWEQQKSYNTYQRPDDPYAKCAIENGRITENARGDNMCTPKTWKGH